MEGNHPPTQIERVLAGLKTLFPDAVCELDHDNAFQLTAATILSAQCTDKRVNMVTPHLFARWPTARALATASQPDVEKVVQSTGFFRNKAKNLIGMAQRLVEKHDGEVPRTMDEMLALPGVARKTANVVLGTAYGLRTGVVVDTHVGRLSRRLGLTQETDAVKVERDLVAQLPEEEWILFSHRMIWHGRITCDARKPLCDDCLLAPDCPSAGLPVTPPVKNRAKKRVVRQRT